MAKVLEGFAHVVLKLWFPNVTCVKLNWKFNAINDCVAYRYSHLRGSIRI